jgi:hypothetical protein
MEYTEMENKCGRICSKTALFELALRGPASEGFRIDRTFNQLPFAY